jgi:hypothetical protein
MNILKRTVTAALAGMLIGVANAPAWSAASATSAVTNEPAAADAQGIPAVIGYRSPLGFLGSVMTEAVPHDRPKTCRASQLYSQHDVVGDPESCFMGRITLPGGAVAGTSGR